MIFFLFGNVLRVIFGDFGNLVIGFFNIIVVLRYICLIFGFFLLDLGELFVFGEFVVVVVGGEVVVMGDSILGDFRDFRGEFINLLVLGEVEDNVICGIEI